MILESGFNGARVRSVLYEGEPVELTGDLQHDLCAAAGAPTPGSDLSLAPSRLSAGTYWLDKRCAYSPEDNYVVQGTCAWHEEGVSGHYGFTHVSGTLGDAKGYMCTYQGCRRHIVIKDDQVRNGYSTGVGPCSGMTNCRPTINPGDSVFCGSLCVGCINCPVGKYVDVTGSAAEGYCIECPVGQYVDVEGSESVGECINCPPGQFVNATGSDSVEDCNECPVGQYNPGKGETCPDDSLTSSELCNDSGNGCTWYEGSCKVDGSKCFDCPANKYVETQGSDSVEDCIDCVAGKYVDEVGRGDG